MIYGILTTFNCLVSLAIGSVVFLVLQTKANDLRDMMSREAEAKAILPGDIYESRHADPFGLDKVYTFLILETKDNYVSYCLADYPEGSPTTELATTFLKYRTKVSSISKK